MSAALAEPVARRFDPSRPDETGTDAERAFALANGVLLGMIGESFRHVRVSYGGELQLHFGELREPKSAKLKGKVTYASYALGLRASAWILSPGAADITFSDHGHLLDDLREVLGDPIGSTELEVGHAIQPGAVVVSASAFFADPVDGVGLKLTLSDGTKLVVLPCQTAETADDTPIADWELFTPKGFVLQVGPGTLAVRKPS